MNYPILSLRVVRFNDETLAEPIAIAFGPAGGTIGRANDCTLVLPDQQRAISRVHARVEFRDGDYLLCDLGSNPSVLNQRALGGTREARLADGDRLVIGPYLLEVSIGEQAAGVRGLTGGRDPLSAAQVLSGPLPADSQGDVLQLGALDPLGQPGFGESQRISSRPGFAGSESDHVSPELQAFSAPQAPRPDPGRPATPAGGIPADYDPLADALAQWETPAQGGGSPAAPHPAHELPGWPTAPAPLGGPTGLPPGLLDAGAAGSAATPFDDLFGTPSTQFAPSTPSAPVVPVVVPVVAPQAATARVAMPAAAPEPAPSPAAQPALQPDPQQVQHPAASAGRISSPPAAPAPSAQTAPVRHDAAASASPNPATLQALLEGLGLDPSRAPNLPEPEFARLIGTMLREALRGTMGVLRARSMTKREARLDTTMIVARDNNPLKFFPDVDSALAQMLTGRSAGYLPPDEALRRAFDDIEAHELAVLAGMRAALAHVLGRFDPASIEAQLKDPGALEKVLSNRKAKLWDLFVAVQGAVAREADDDFQKLFGQAFNDAYEAQIDELSAARARQPKHPADPT
ncbi:MULTISPECIES: type VI secretion system-associated FHA domain protein TagH [Paraburkholderia]|uniref:Type VI secretion system-associated FHA domain protein TagH n=1 Tax=Paraburkholderia podalyriae TaxID=1938811 RepID=A0ABR7PVF9_9BURK|nr:type VI secretion system-associated FHA domain protein TagH [Paraburkholderia podalyriae]MBC8750265.1 type VI secretion system-associated FHA domain protein TagH [Paraburkholderia podalyriae]